MNFSDFKNSSLSSYYHFKNDICCVFNTSEYSVEELDQLTLFAREYVSSGFLFQTSGTTADKKFVLHDFSSVLASCQSINLWVKAESEDIFCSPISIHHMGGFSVLARALVAGAPPAIIIRDWNLNEFIDICKKQNVTIASMVPSQIYEIVQQNLKSPSSLQTVFVGGSDLEDTVYKKALDLK